MTVSSALDLWGFQEGRIWGLRGSSPWGGSHLSWSISTANAVMNRGHEGRAETIAAVAEAVDLARYARGHHISRAAESQRR